MRFGEQNNGRGWFGQAMRVACSLLFAALITVILFLVLPLMQQIGRPPDADLVLREVGTAHLPPPPPPPVQAEPKEPGQAEQLPELAEEAPPLVLNQLELALNPGFGEAIGGDFAIRLPGAKGAAGEEADAIFSMTELDQKPRIIYQPAPDYPAELRRKKIQGTVNVLFTVDRGGRTTDPVVQKSTHPAFERPALQAVKRWRFEPGTRNGKPVQFKMRVPITFVSR